MTRHRFAHPELFVGNNEGRLSMKMSFAPSVPARERKVGELEKK